MLRAWRILFAALSVAALVKRNQYAYRYGLTCATGDIRIA